MSDDDETKDRRVSTGTIPLSDDDLVEIPSFPDFPNREEFVKTLEMDSETQQYVENVSADTRPIQQVLETTQRYEVPDELLEAASRSDELAIYQDWGEFLAHVDHRGRVLLPSRTHKMLRGKTIRVRFRIVDEDGD